MTGRITMLIGNLLSFLFFFLSVNCVCTIIRFADRDMVMRYHWGLGIGHTLSHGSSEYLLGSVITSESEMQADNEDNNIIVEQLLDDDLETGRPESPDANSVLDEYSVADSESDTRDNGSEDEEVWELMGTYRLD